MARMLKLQPAKDESWEDALARIELLPAPPPCALWDRLKKDPLWKTDLWIQRVQTSDPPLPKPR